MEPQRESIPDSGEPAAARSEQVFFSDPAVDRVMGVLFALATEHYVLHDRVRALEEQLCKNGQVSREALSAAVPESDAAAHRDAAEFAQALLRPLLGVQLAKGAAGKFSLAASRRR
jgi:hypothetical protein